MSASLHLVGRLAQLDSLLAKPELNGVYVLILAFLSNKKRFSVRTIPAPNEEGSAVIISVKLESLRLFQERNFYDDYPHPNKIQVVHLEAHENEIRNGTILQLDNMQGKLHNLTVTKSHRILGKKVALDNNGIPHPETLLPGNIHVSADEDDHIVEFEDILFANHPFYLTKGKHTTFRRCTFQSAFVTICPGRILTVVDWEYVYDRCMQIGPDAVPNVVFESCLFTGTGTDTSQPTMGVSAGSGCTVTFLNCVFRNLTIGVSSIGGEHLEMIHCLVENCTNGVGAREKAGGLDMLNCTIRNNQKSGVLLDRAGPAVISGCKIESCQQAGVYARSRSKHTSSVELSRCTISHCLLGLCVDMGGFAVRVNSCLLNYHQRYGIMICPSAMGSVALHQSRLESNRERDILNGSHAEGLLTIDNVPQKPTESGYNTPKELYAQRCYQQAGLADISCDNCGKVEATGEKFKKCGKCENACYCSRECQKAYWKEHKKVCESTYAVAMSNVARSNFS